MEPNTPHEVDVKSKGKNIQCRFIFKEDDKQDIVLEVSLPVAVALHKKLDLSILKVLENYTRL